MQICVDLHNHDINAALLCTAALNHTVTVHSANCSKVPTELSHRCPRRPGCCGPCLVRPSDTFAIIEFVELLRVPIAPTLPVGVKPRWHALARQTFSCLPSASMVDEVNCMVFQRRGRCSIDLPCVFASAPAAYVETYACRRAAPDGSSCPAWIQFRCHRSLSYPLHTSLPGRDALSRGDS